MVEILKLGENAKIASIATSALLAGAAGAARCGPSVQRTARDQLARGLARCRDEPCRAVRLRALGHLRLADSAALLLAAAERAGGEGAAAALSALRAAPLSAVHVERLVLLASNASRSLTERALALELAADRSTAGAAGVVPLVLVRLARALRSERGAAAHELRRALWQRLDSLAEREAVRALHRVLPRDLRSWDARAHAGECRMAGGACVRVCVCVPMCVCGCRYDERAAAGDGLGVGWLGRSAGLCAAGVAGPAAARRGHAAGRRRRRRVRTALRKSTLNCHELRFGDAFKGYVQVTITNSK